MTDLTDIARSSHVELLMLLSGTENGWQWRVHTKQRSQSLQHYVRFAVRRHSESFATLYEKVEEEL